jgi:flagellar basal-body rod protein FlgC
MSGSDIFAIVGSSLDAQNARMGAIASNLANVDSITPPGGVPYRAHEVVFQAAPVDGGDGAMTAANGESDAADGSGGLGVSVAGTVLSNAPPKQTYDPGSPYADAQGYVTGSNVSQVSQMVDLIDSSNSYAASVAVLQQATRVDQQMISSFEVS